LTVYGLSLSFLQQFSHQGTKAQRRDMNYKTLRKKEESLSEKL
jgi:hypothetical protein